MTAVPPVPVEPPWQRHPADACRRCPAFPAIPPVPVEPPVLPRGATASASGDVVGADATRAVLGQSAGVSRKRRSSPRSLFRVDAGGAARGLAARATRAAAAVAADLAGSCRSSRSFRSRSRRTPRKSRCMKLSGRAFARAVLASLSAGTGVAADAAVVRVGRGVHARREADRMRAPLQVTGVPGVPDPAVPVPFITCGAQSLPFARWCTPRWGLRQSQSPKSCTHAFHHHHLCSQSDRISGLSVWRTLLQ